MLGITKTGFFLYQLASSFIQNLKCEIRSEVEKSTAFDTWLELDQRELR